MSENRRSGYQFPKDTLSHPLSSSAKLKTIPTRYTSERYIQAKSTSNYSTKEFILDEDQETKRYKFSKDLSLSPQQNRILKDRGLLFSYDDESNVKLNINCQLTIYDEMFVSSSLSDIIMTVIKKGCDVSFKINFENNIIPGLDFNFKQDVELCYFNNIKSCMGIQLNKKRLICLPGNEKQNSRFLLIESNMPHDGTLSKVKFILKSVNIKIELYLYKDTIISQMKEVADKEYLQDSMGKSSSDKNLQCNKKRQMKILDKKNIFSSLSFKNVTKMNKKIISSGNKILLPEVKIDSYTQDELSDKEAGFFLENSNNASNKISSSAFYGTHKDEDSDEKKSLAIYSHSSLKKSLMKNINSNIYEPSNFSNSQEEFEKPETFKPTLLYKFEDGVKYSVNNQDFKCLYNNDWINDTILDFFTKYYIEKSISCEIIKREDIYLFSSFFYTKLVSNLDKCYENVKKWVTTSDLLKKKYIVVPINVNYHWFCCIITKLDVVNEHSSSEEYCESQKGPSIAENLNTINTKNLRSNSDIQCPTITIMVYDSLRQNHSREVEPLKKFLIEYLKDKYELDIPKSQIKMKMCLVPQQPNMSDCGVHVILNTKKFFEDPKTTMRLWSAKSSRQHIKDINIYFGKQERQNARKKLRKVLQNLQKEQIERNGGSWDHENETCHDIDNQSDIEIIENFDNTTIAPNHKEINENLEHIDQIEDHKVYTLTNIKDHTIQSKEEALTDTNDLITLESALEEVKPSTEGYPRKYLSDSPSPSKQSTDTISNHTKVPSSKIYLKNSVQLSSPSRSVCYLAGNTLQNDCNFRSNSPPSLSKLNTEDLEDIETKPVDGESHLKHAFPTNKDQLHNKSDTMHIPHQADGPPDSNTSQSIDLIPSTSSLTYNSLQIIPPIPGRINSNNIQTLDSFDDIIDHPIMSTIVSQEKFEKTSENNDIIEVIKIDSSTQLTQLSPTLQKSKNIFQPIHVDDHMTFDSTTCPTLNLRKELDVKISNYDSNVMDFEDLTSDDFKTYKIHGFEK